MGPGIRGERDSQGHESETQVQTKWTLGARRTCAHSNRCISVPDRAQNIKISAPVEDLQLLVGRYEHENQWKDYVSTVNGPVRNPIAQKRVSLALRRLGAIPEILRKNRPVVTGIAVCTRAPLEPSPPLLEPLLTSITSRHTGALGDATSYLHVARAGGLRGSGLTAAQTQPGIPSLTRVGFITPSKGLLPPYAVQVTASASDPARRACVSAGGHPEGLPLRAQTRATGYRSRARRSRKIK